MRLMIVAALVLAAAGQIGAQEAPVLRLTHTEDQIIQVQTKVRHTTVIVLPAKENILDFVVGDSEYWHLTGAANLAFLKPIAEGVKTNVALISESGRIYSFLVAERSAGQPHLVVRIEPPEEDDPRISPAAHEPAFVSRDQVTAYQQMAQQATETARTAKQERRHPHRRGRAADRGRSRSVPRGLPHAAQVPLPPGGQGHGVAVSGRGHVARRALHLPAQRTPRSLPHSTKSRTASPRW